MASRTELRVGAFVLLGMAAIGGVIFLIGDARRMFESKVIFTATFEDIDGLSRGSPVHMGGLGVGQVVGAEYGEDPRRSEVIVTLAVVKSEARRVRTDSRATIAPKGLLGDKLISLSVGSPDLPPMPEGSRIPAGESHGIFERANAILGNLEKTSGTLAEDQFRDDIQASVRATRRILEAVDKGEGYVPRLFHDRAEADKLSNALSNLDGVTQQLHQLLIGVNRAVTRVNQGPGLAHALLYSEEGSRVAEQIGHAADEFALTLEGIRTGDGLTHELLFGGASPRTDRILSDVTAISGDTRAMVHDLRMGKGTLGALLVDPSVYEDLKVLLGNVQRNEVLRALVRFSIRQDEQRPRVEVKDTKPSGAAAGAKLGFDAK